MDNRVSTTARAVLTGLGALHLVVSIWHGAAHAELNVLLSPAQTLFVYAVILGAPLVAIGLLWTRYEGPSLWLFLVAMAASLLFGIYYHYVFVSPDNVHHLPTGAAEVQEHFVESAGIVALVELAGALAAAFVLGAYRAAGSRSHGKSRNGK